MTDNELQAILLKHLITNDGKRRPMLAILIGTTGTGKSTLIRKLLKVNPRNLILPSNQADANRTWPGIAPLTYRWEWIDDETKPGKKTNAVVVNDLDTFRGARLLFADGQPAVFDAAASGQHGFNAQPKGPAGLHLDDFRNYLYSKGTLRQPADMLLRNRRHRMLDITMACHGFEDVSRDLMRFDPVLFVFRTTLPPNEASLDKVRNPGFEEMVERVNTRAKQNPHYFEAFIPSY